MTATPTMIDTRKCNQALLDACQAIKLSTSHARLIHELVLILRRSLQFDSWAIFSLDSSGKRLVPNRLVNNHCGRLAGWVIPVENSILGAVFRAGQAEMINEADRDPRLLHAPGAARVGSLLGLPLNLHAGVRSLFLIQRAKPPFSMEEFELAQIFNGYLSLAVDNVMNTRGRVPPHLQKVNAWLADCTRGLREVLFQRREADSYLQAVLALARAVDARDHGTGCHSQKLADWCAAISREMQCSNHEVQNIYYGALLHDVGKIAIPDAILNKQGKLTDQEWTVMRRHPQLGRDILAPIETMKPILPYVEGHHECWDGSGYPNGIAGKKIPLGARIIKVADVFGAVTEDRPYHRAQSSGHALALLERGCRTQFDPDVVAVFNSLLQQNRLQTASL